MSFPSMQEKVIKTNSFVGVKKLVESKVREEMSNAMQNIRIAKEIISKGKSVLSGRQHTADGTVNH